MKIPSSDPESAHQIGLDDICSCHLEKVTRPLLGVPNRFSWSMGYRSAMNILCPDSESPQKTSPDTSQTIPNGGGHISRFSQI